MARCCRCNKKALFLKVNSQGICKDCKNVLSLLEEENKIKESINKLNIELEKIQSSLNKLEINSLESDYTPKKRYIVGGLEEMKIGVIARTVLYRVLESGKISEEEINLMQNKEYSKEAFDIQYPALLKVSKTDGKSPLRYYSTPVKINGEKYFVCSEWYEVPANNDRPHLMRWLALHG